MAEESGGESWWGAWGTEFLSNVKAKSAETLSLVKQDLSEFVTTIQHDTTVTVAETAANVKEKLKVEEDETDGSTTAVIRQGVSQWFGSLSTALRENVSQMTAIVDEEPTNTGPAGVFDRIQARVHEIQTNPSTYCNDPDGHPAHFEEWHEKFDLEQHKTEISELLVNRPEIRSLYTKLVPSAVTNYLFWTRYFYKIHQFEQEEKRKAALVERANKMDEEELGWGDEDDPWDVEEASSKDPTHSSASDKLIHVEQEATPPDTKQQKETLGNKKDIKTKNDPKLLTTKDKSKAVDEEQLKPLKREGQSDPSDENRIADENTAEELPEDKHPSDSIEKPKASSTSEDKLALPDKSTSLPNKNDCDEPRQSSTPQPCIEENQPTNSDSLTTSDNLNRENSSNSSVDSSWSKLSEEDLKHNGIKTERNEAGQHDVSSHRKAPSPSHSERSSSSLVVIPPVQEKDIDWDDDDDFDVDVKGGDVTSANKDTIKSTEVEDDDDDWENWE